jgi:hypothetical protein
MDGEIGGLSLLMCLKKTTKSILEVTALNHHTQIDRASPLHNMVLAHPPSLFHLRNLALELNNNWRKLSTFIVF